MSILFVLIAATLTIGVMLLLVLPLLRPPSQADARENDKRLSVYRQQLAELEQDRVACTITQEQFEHSRRELERRVLEETTTDPVQPWPSRWYLSSRRVALALIVMIPITGFLLYWMLGNPLAFVHPGVQVTETGENLEYAHQSSSGLDVLTDRLKQRMEQNPTDGAGWALLARSYVELGRHGDAVTAFDKAVALIPDDAQLLVDYADALAMARGGKLEGKPEELITRALKLDPRSVKGHMLAGTIAYDRKEFRTALTHWEQAQKNLPPEIGPELVQELDANVSEVRGLLGLASVPTPSAGPAKSGRLSASSSTGLAITGTITLAPRLARKGSPTDTLFVFARAVNGPPMPVAIVRATKQDLPFTFRLDDSTSPMPPRKLSEAGSVVIVARLSTSGEAMPKSGDLQGVSQPVKPGAQGLNVAIDSELP
jgi:cytochrome c-type biogenesis protein CcmH